MVTITVCIGSGCHVRGARKIIEKIKQYIVDYDLDCNITLKGCFCQNLCNEGVIVKFNDLLVSGVTTENIISYVKKYVVNR
ncbi:(2Fe-2S) ferredoxin domain-containing protein [Haloplasma contractile]|uniref:Respiratory-chain NADH dehydrogenase 24 Kd subunit protein n=1 Tax=Haloplasma contractile SSD-17B TaxID=1033810 RepID=F7PVY9_9MOLU|nr:(2Fe-2S) ferredoxin domain-containing protein [Haloplasma contractile]ERJ12687.1 Respiratory-chain NADH dehydrogenase 24 Kd subunit protein [Haloplasma contractile SSD-17B]